MSTCCAASFAGVCVTQPDSSSGQVKSPEPNVQSPAAQTFNTQQGTCNWSWHQHSNILLHKRLIRFQSVAGGSAWCRDCRVAWCYADPPATLHSPFSFVSAQLTNSKGDKIFYPVTDDRDRQWARRLKYAIDRHREIADDDIVELNSNFSAVLRESKESHERKYDQAYIADLEGKLAAAFKTMR